MCVFEVGATVYDPVERAVWFSRGEEKSALEISA